LMMGGLGAGMDAGSFLLCWKMRCLVTMVDVVPFCMGAAAYLSCWVLYLTRYWLRQSTKSSFLSMIVLCIVCACVRNFPKPFVTCPSQRKHVSETPWTTNHDRARRLSLHVVSSPSRTTSVHALSYYNQYLQPSTTATSQHKNPLFTTKAKSTNCAAVYARRFQQPPWYRITNSRDLPLASNHR
jgi:hypothetical protein